MRTLFLLTLTFFFAFPAAAQQTDADAQEHEATDIDEWQTLKVEAARDPFAYNNEFTINFINYAIEDWHYPLPGAHVISPFGGQRHHAGTDIKRMAGDTIRAAFTGEVIVSSPYYAYGNCVIMRHANGLETLYSHNVKNLVRKGQWVHAGDPVALVGRTGRATTEHLHFETRVKGKAFDSSLLFDHEAGTLIKQIVVFRKTQNGALQISRERAKDGEVK